MKADLVRDEGVRNTPYKDSLGNWTIGVGHLMSGIPSPGIIWTPSQIDITLELDISHAYDRISNTMAFGACDTDGRKRALVNMSFQLGNRLFQFGNSLRMISEKNWQGAADHLRQSLWYSQTPERAERVIQFLEKG